MSPSDRRERGQATAELALVLPFLVLLCLMLLQVALVVRDQVTLVHAAREAARAASVDADPEAAEDAARTVMPGAVTRSGVRPPPGGFVSVDVAYRSATDVPLVGPLLPDPELKARAVMRTER